MAVTGKKLQELIKLCDKLGIMDTVTRRYAKGAKNPDGSPKEKTGKKEYMFALAKHYLFRKYPDGDVPKHMMVRLKLESLMLAHRITAYKEDLQKEIWENDKYIFEEKADGCRMLIVFFKGEGIHFYSRHVSVEDWLPIEYFNILNNVSTSALGERFDSFIIDSEVVSENPNICTVIGNRGVTTETQLQAVTALLALKDIDESKNIQREHGLLKFIGFDVLMMNRKWIIDEPYLRRRNVLEFMAPELRRYGLNFEIFPIVRDSSVKRRFYEEIVSRGGEGVIAKDVDAKYIASDNRQKGAWTKIKRSVAESLQMQGLGDTIDGFITGGAVGEPGTLNESRISRLEVSVLLRKMNGTEDQHVIAWVSNLTDELMEDLTVNEEGEIKLNPAYLNRVIELNGQNISARNRRLRHAVLDRFRDDKSWTDCTIDEDFLESMIF